MWNKSESKPSAQGSAAPTPVKTDVKADSAAEAKPEIVLQSASPVVANAPSTPAQSSASYMPPPVAPVKKPVVAQSTPTTIGTGLKIKGELSGNSDLLIEGEAQGKIVLTDSKVTIGASGRVTADIEAREILVEGTVQGSLKATEGVHLSASSVVRGTVLTPRIAIKDGARLSAKVEMVRANEPRASSYAGGSGSVSSEASRPMAARAEGA